MPLALKREPILEQKKHERSETNWEARFKTRLIRASFNTTKQEARIHALVSNSRCRHFLSSYPRVPEDFLFCPLPQEELENLTQRDPLSYYRPGPYRNPGAGLINKSGNPTKQKDSAKEKDGITGTTFH